MKELTLAPTYVWGRYNSGIGFNNRISLDEEVEVNENFFIGK